MALKSTIFKVNLTISDMNRNYYEDHGLTLARHPSETDLRMLARVVAFSLNAHEHLQFTKGMSSTEEPDLWQVDLTGEVQHWIELGQPNEKRIRQSCSKARQVTIYTYQGHKNNAAHWFETVKETASRFQQLEVTHLNMSDATVIERLTERTMTLNCNIEGDQVMLTDGVHSLAVQLCPLQSIRNGR